MSIVMAIEEWPVHAYDLQDRPQALPDSSTGRAALARLSGVVRLTVSQRTPAACRGGLARIPAGNRTQQADP